MCGIAGIVTRDGSPPSEEILRRMSHAVAHRGPDGDGIWTSPGIGLAHRRLAIIDLSPEAAQPMSDTSGIYRIVFNGEIYNYRDLRHELEGRGVRFRTRSDTEVILESVRAWGLESLTRLRGMFAFAIWDASARRLVLARDKIGKKPLFYAFTPSGHLAFASEMKALRPCCDLKPDWEAVRLFLGLQYVPSPRTGFEGVWQLLPGSYGVWQQGTWNEKKYHEWNVGAGSPRPPVGRAERRGNRAPTETEGDEQIRLKLNEAVKIRELASDVPVGAFLSGGIDSAAVVAFASKHVSRPLETFTMGFPNFCMDERKEARAIAEQFGTDHQDFEARPEHLLELVEELTTHYDAPYADSSALPLWLLARETAKEIKVVLTGDGGDELFGGYHRYAWYERALRLAKIPFAGRASGVGRRSSLIAPNWRRFLETVSAARHDPARAYGELFCGAYFSTNRLCDTFDSMFLSETASADAVNFIAHSIASAAAQCAVGAQHAVPLRDAMYFDLTSYLPDDLNVKMDRATMRFGLEARSPFLDQELVAYALTLPLHQKMYRGNKKIALKRALSGILPDAALNRKKRGFQVPLAEWFRGPLAGILRDRIMDPSAPIAHLIQHDTVSHLLTENARGRDHGNRLWMLLTLSMWLSRYAV